MSMFLKMILSAMVLTFSLSSVAGEGRNHGQRERIRNGVKSGQLTKEEAHALRGERKELHKMRKDAKADGTVTDEEKSALKDKRKEVSKEIHSEKHDAESASPKDH